LARRQGYAMMKASVKPPFSIAEGRQLTNNTPGRMTTGR
jgi:hypothetical protein